MNEENNIPIINADPEYGLTNAQAQLRAEKGLINKPTVKTGRTEGQIIRENTCTFFNLVFVIMAVALFLAGSSVVNMTFMVIVIVNAIIGCFQEIRAKRAVDKLTLLSAHTVKTLRNGKLKKLRFDELVRDDIVLYGPGDQISADGVLRSGHIYVNESLLTGEADAVEKHPGDPLLSGSFVVTGNGKMQLTQVGDEAFATKLALEAKKNPRAARSEMMRSLDLLIRFIGIALVPIGLLLFYNQYKSQNLGLQVSAEATVAALVGMIPEGLYLLTSIALAVSSLKLTQKRVLVQDMHCVETLARVDTLCVDKTGTITEPIMQAEEVIPLSHQSPEYLEEIIVNLYGDEDPENETARALQELFPGNPTWKKNVEIPFSSDYKWKGAVFADSGAFVVGAPDAILGAFFPDISKTANHWSSLGYRVLLIAAYEGTPRPGQLVASKLHPEALVLMTNRIRPEAPETFAYFVKQGVTVKVISGDNPATVSDVARRAGIENADRYIDTSTLETDKDFLKAAEEYTVFGRVTPDKKKRLIWAMKQRKHTVAMTGDGVNDVLAMKEADCGIAMAGGAQAASQIAQLVLLDADFSAMPSIVDEGRRVINNIQRAAALFLVKNILSLFLALIAVLADWPYPFAPINLSLISALTIGVPSFFLALEPNYERVKGRFIVSVLRQAFPGGLTNILMVVTAQIVLGILGAPMAQVQTVCTAILAVTGLLVLLSVSKPFDRFRLFIWAMMAIALVFSFLFLGGILQLQSVSLANLPVLGILLAVTPVVYWGLRRLFDLGDRVVAKIRSK
ncbi:MAG: HAD family hydrolase [Ruminococcaceae bacterium]|nr:HAD family hydrolase [Oscillospiraceae bacterium]